MIFSIDGKLVFQIPVICLERIRYYLIFVFLVKQKRNNAFEVRVKIYQLFFKIT